MMRACLIVLISFFSLSSYGQSRFSPILKKELDSLLILDQKYRAAIGANMRGKGDSLSIIYGVKKEDLNDYLWKLQGEIDSLNTVRIGQILKLYGYPGISLVGKTTNEAAFYIIQHSKVTDKYLPVIKEAAEKNELRFVLYAMMLDRSLMFQDKEQLYGTQGSGMSVKNKETGKWENLSFIWPIKDPAKVNKRRKAAGFEETVEENAKSIGIEYKIFTLDEILRLRSEIMNAGVN
jgi:hypothetical protein